VSQWIAADEHIAELDINPLVVYDEGHGAVAVDMRVATRDT
jgi:succinyl-CoA synthetase beta subunit